MLRSCQEKSVKKKELIFAEGDCDGLAATDFSSGPFWNNLVVGYALSISVST
jgi:hypothetical protein